jgi:hypothetical protein
MRVWSRVWPQAQGDPAHLSLPALQQAVCRTTGVRLHAVPGENATLGLLHSFMLVFSCFCCWWISGCFCRGMLKRVSASPGCFFAR